MSELGQQDNPVVEPRAATPATAFSTQMQLLIANAGGNIEQLIPSLQNGKQRCFIADIPLAGQASGTVIAAARLYVPYTMISITALASVSLGTSTIAIGRPNDSANSGFWSAAGTLTATTPVSLGSQASLGVPVLVGYDYLGDQAGYQPGHSGGGGYDDIIVTTGAAALPGAGGLRLFFEYMIE